MNAVSDALVAALTAALSPDRVRTSSTELGLYRRDASGRQMLVERHADFERRFGRRSDSVASRQYLTPAELDRLGRELGLRWQRSRPFYGWRWAARPWVARLRRRRPPSRFELLVGRP